MQFLGNHFFFPSPKSGDQRGLGEGSWCDEGKWDWGIGEGWVVSDLTLKSVPCPSSLGLIPHSVIGGLGGVKLPGWLKNEGGGAVLCLEGQGACLGECFADAHQRLWDFLHPLCGCKWYQNFMGTLSSIPTESLVESYHDPAAFQFPYGSDGQVQSWLLVPLISSRCVLNNPKSCESIFLY